MRDLTVKLQNKTLVLLPERALFWPQRSTLIVADLHLGKAATLRAATMSVLGGTTTADLARLSHILDRTQAKRLVLLGDLLHAKTERVEALFDAVTTWRERHIKVEVLLVRGNHDQHAGSPPNSWGVECVDAPLIEPPFALHHHPNATPGSYTLAGRIHPAIVLSGLGRSQEKLPCFHFGPEVGLLPAFGSFTDTATVQPNPGDRIYVIAEDEVLPAGDQIGG